MAGYPPRRMEHILPSNASDYERVLASQVNQLLEHDTDRIKNLWNPWKAHIDDLPYLAWAMSVDLWDQDWPDLKKRSVVAHALELHRLKGTEEGIRRHIATVDSSLLRTIAPPARGFYTPAMTEAGRKRWLQGLPQVRIYPFLNRREAPKKRAFYCGPGGHQSFYRSEQHGPYSFAQASDGPSHYGRRATFYDNGAEVDANYEVFQDALGQTAERVLIRGSNRKRSFFGRTHFGSGFYQKTQAETNVVNVRLSNDASRQFSVFSGAVTTDVRPERIYSTRTTPKGRMFFGAKKRGFYMTTFAPNLIYDRITILDKTRLGERKKVRSFWGHSRYGIQPFSAELLVEIPMRRPRPRLGKFMTGFWKKADMKHLDQTIQSIRVSKSFRDTIRVDTQVHKTLTIKDAKRLGTFKLGELRRVV